MLEMTKYEDEQGIINTAATLYAGTCCREYLSYFIFTHSRCPPAAFDTVRSRACLFIRITNNYYLDDRRHDDGNPSPH